jgi:putative transposase
MTIQLRCQGYPVNPKRIRQLMRRMGLEAVYPRKRLSVSSPEHPKHPYLLRRLKIDHPDQVWYADVTYIRMHHGFVYLVAIMDWFSRYILAWDLSITLDTSFCVQALQDALKISTPEIFNTDQGAQFTSSEFLHILEAAGIRLSMDGRGRVYNNIFVERLWRSVKYEEVYLHDYRTVSETRPLLGAYFQFYNTERFHEGLDYLTPHEVYGRRQFNINSVQATPMHLKQAHLLS